MTYMNYCYNFSCNKGQITTKNIKQKGYKKGMQLFIDNLEFKVYLF